MAHKTNLTPVFVTLLSIVVAACAAPTPAATATPLPTDTPAGQVETQVAATISAGQTSAAEVAQAVALTLTAAVPTPTNTLPPSPTATATPTPAPTDTPTAVPTAVSTLAATRPPAAAATKAPPPASASVYGLTGGPDQFFSTISCFYAKGDCISVMPPGDVNFSFTLGSTADAPFALFLPYGLSVEKDGANAAEMFMFVDAGWLRPGYTVGFGGSRNFTQPGRYVVRSSGCMLTVGVQCVWTTMAGTIVTFVIQP